MRMRHVLLVAWLAGLVACAKGEDVDSGKGWSMDGGSGTGGSGTSGSGGSSGSTGTCDLQTSDATCNQCINTTCLSQCNACANSTACMALLDCMKSCSDATCDNTCLGQNPAGEAPLNAFVGENGCMTVQCADACGSTGCGLTTSDAACDDCLNTKCFSECSACANTPDCLSLLDCLLGCDDTLCEDSCLQAYPSGADPLLDLAGTDGCLTVSCAVECG